jgi:hypothetical protein
VHIGTTEVQHSDDHRVSEREKRDTDTSRDSWDEKKFYKQEFLDTGVLRKYCRDERATDTGIYKESRKT